MLNIIRLLKQNIFIFIIAVFTLCALIFYFYLQSITGTRNAFVIAKIRPVSSQVSGLIDKIYVKNNQYVKKGDRLFSIQKNTYLDAVNTAKANLAAAKFRLESLEVQVQRSKKDTEAKMLALKIAKFNAENAKKLAELYAGPKDKATNLISTMQIAQSEYQASLLNQKIVQLSINSTQQQIHALQNILNEQLINLKRTTTYALSNGSVSNLNLAPGAYVEASTPLFAFISTDTWWVQANIKENKLGEVRKGQQVEIQLPMYPNHRFHGVVSDTAWAVNRQETDPRSVLPIVIKENQWFILPQRFPVLIRITDRNKKEFPLHVGATAWITIKS